MRRSLPALKGIGVRHRKYRVRAPEYRYQGIKYVHPYLGDDNNKYPNSCMRLLFSLRRNPPLADTRKPQMTAPHHPTANPQRHHVGRQQPPETAVVPFADARSQHGAVVVEGGDAAIAGAAVVGAEGG